MIQITASILYITKNNKKINRGRWKVKEWTNDKLADFDFNYMNPEAWRNYLLNDFRMSNGKKLPLKTEDGEDIVYSVVMRGLSEELIDTARYYSAKGKAVGYFSFFPGYPEEEIRNKRGSIKPLRISENGKLKK